MSISSPDAPDDAPDNSKRDATFAMAKGTSTKGARIKKSMRLQPVTESFSLKEHIYGVLRAAILDMNIYDDDVDLRLDERNMAQQLGISRTPIREALARLEQESYVDIIPRKGVYVRRKSVQEVLEMIVVWAALESMAARMATQVAHDADLESLRSLAMQCSLDTIGANIAEYSDANIRFHQKVLELSGCAMLKDIADGLFMHMGAVRRRAMGEGNRVHRSVVDHMSIIEAIESRDGELASTLVREHTMRLHEHVKKTWHRLEGIGKSDTEDISGTKPATIYE